MIRSGRVRALEFSGILFASFTAPLAIGESSKPAEDLRAAYGGADVISLATGYERPLVDAPVTATIYSRDDIRRSGVYTLSGLLSQVPGYYVTSNDARSTQLTVRGITSRVLILVNNIPLYQGFVNATQTLDDVLLYDVERVEVTRGPGSAVFGADAVSGIVNIITRTASSEPIAEVGAVAGEFRTAGAYGLYGTRVRELDLRMYGAYYESDETDRVLEADAQTNLDRLLRTRASLAPGPINGGRKVAEARISLAGEHWSARASHRNEFDFETGTGLTFALDPLGTYDSRVSSVELVHQSAPSENWALRGYLAAIQVDQTAEDVHPYPAGAFRGAFPNGVQHDFTARERRFRGEMSAIYSGFARQTLLVTGGGYIAEYDTLTDVRNYIVRRGVVLPTGPKAQGAGVNDPEIISDTHRDVGYVVLQDEWSPIADWIITAGVRYDLYSDFGSTVNPRAAVVWSPTASTTMKLLYGTAFRPPSVIELESNGTFAALGNRTLNPATLSMTELSVSHRRSAWTASVAGFLYRQDDLVQTAPNALSPTGQQFVNREDGDQGWGVELSLARELSSVLSVQGYYTYQEHTGSAADNSNAQQAPRHQVSVFLNYSFAPLWRVNTAVQGIFNRGRASSDPRPDPPDYAVVNLTLERSELPGHVDMLLSAHNLFDREINDPSDSPNSLPADIPVPGRMWFAELRKRF